MVDVISCTPLNGGGLLRGAAGYESGGSGERGGEGTEKMEAMSKLMEVGRKKKGKWNLRRLNMKREGREIRRGMIKKRKESYDM